MAATIETELAELAKNHKGILRPGDVVNAARDEESSLHSWFDWDDSAAAAKWRIRQARELLRVRVTVLTEDSEPVRAYVSLVDDQKVEGGGYRAIADVLNDDELYMQLLAQALDEYQRVAEKYKDIQELQRVRDEIRRARKKTKVA